MQYRYETSIFFSNHVVDIWNSLPALQQLSLTPVWLFLTKFCEVNIQQFLTLFSIYCACVSLLCHVFYCDVRGRLVLLLLIKLN